MKNKLLQIHPRTIAVIGGISYLFIFFSAVYANFFMLEPLKAHPLETLEHHSVLVRSGIMAFMIAALFDVVVAWVLFKLFEYHPLTLLSS